MKKVNSCFRVLLSTVLFVLSANAQKLPAIQEASLRAPASIKIDGKPTEWSNQLQAYNKTTEIFYTLANDKDKLYFVVQATNPDIVNKIICGGVTLTINNAGKIKDGQGIAITYPALEIDRRPVFPRGHPPINLEHAEDRTQSFSWIP